MDSVQTDTRADLLCDQLCQDRLQSRTTLFSTMLRQDPELRGIVLWGSSVSALIAQLTLELPRSSSDVLWRFGTGGLEKENWIKKEKEKKTAKKNN